MQRGEYTEAMVDIETLGTNNNAIVLSIGAVVFNLSDWDEYDGMRDDRVFHIRMNLKEQEDKGMKADIDTVRWWMGQNKAAQAALKLDDEGCHVWEALNLLDEWWERAGGGKHKLNSWGNGPNFDQKIVTSLYHHFDRQPPWYYRQERCLRTLRDLAGKPDLKNSGIVRGVEHNALEDAKFQVLCAQFYYQKIFP